MDYTSIKVGQLPTGEISGGNFIPHEVAGVLKKATFTDLAAFIGASDAVGFRAVSVQNGGTLPTTDTQEFILVGPGTYNNVGGGSTITVTEELNALVSNGTYWFVGVEIPIDAPPGNAIWGQIIGTLSNQTDLKNILDLKADLVDGKVPASQLPSYVDDIIEVANYAALPATGETGKIYLTLDNNKIYRWSGSVYIEIAAENAVWGQIVGTLSNQTDLQSALNAKVPYTGATANVDLGTHTLSSYNLVVNHTSGSGVAAQITKGGNGEALTVSKSSGTGNAASILGGVTLLSELHLNTSLSDTYIASAATWNAKQNALNGTGFVKISGTTISYDNTSYLPLTGGTLTGTLNVDGSGGTTAPIVSIFNTGLNRLLTPVLRLYGADTIASKYIELLGSNATSNRQIQFPDASGTVALVSQIIESRGKWQTSDNQRDFNYSGKRFIVANDNAANSGIVPLNTLFLNYNTDFSLGTVLHGNLMLGANSNTTAASYKLDIQHSSDFDIRLRDTSLGGTVGILFETANNFSGTSQAYIKGIGESGAGRSSLIFGTGAAAGDVTATERMRITSVGNVQFSQISTLPSDNNTIYTTSANNYMYIQGGSQGLALAAQGNRNNVIYVNETTNFIRFDVNASERMRISSGGNIGIGTSSPTHLLHVSLPSGQNGQILRLSRSAGSYSWGLGINSSTSSFDFHNDGGSIVANINFSTGAYTATSDERLKENIEDSDLAIEKILDIKVRKYDWKNSDIKEDFGFVAQELFEVLPQYVQEGNEETNWGVAKAELVPLLVKAIQELKAEIDLLKAK
jgi:hypothetical protein